MCEELDLKYVVWKVYRGCIESVNKVCMMYTECEKVCKKVCESLSCTHMYKECVRECAPSRKRL